MNEERKKKDRQSLGKKIIIIIIESVVVLYFTTFLQDPIMKVIAGFIGALVLDKIVSYIIKGKSVKEQIEEITDDPKRAILQLISTNIAVIPDAMKEKIIETYDNVQNINDNIEKLKLMRFSKLINNFCKIHKCIELKNENDAIKLLKKVIIETKLEDFVALNNEAQLISQKISK